ncbi:MAG: STAS domain-containing protein [bacterium]
MSLAISEREREGITILDLAGRITVGEEAAGLRERFRTLAAAGRNRVILNLREVDYIDSTGLGVIVMGYTALRRSGGGLVLEHLSERSIELLVLTKLSTIFDVFDDEQQAVNSFFPDRHIRKFDILSFVREQGKE